MAEEGLVASPVPSPTLTDHKKRKLKDFEAPAPESTTQSPLAVSDPDSSKNDAEEEENGGADELELKRPRLEANVNEPDVLVSQNGHQEEVKGGELKDEEIEQSEAAIDNSELVLDAHEPVKESLEVVTEEQVFNEYAEAENGDDPEQSKAKVEESSKELPEENNVPSDELQSVSETQIISRQMEVPNDKGTFSEIFRKNFVTGRQVILQKQTEELVGGIGGEI